ncbi:hypothetical protein RHMOL_Rhmol05G0106400 [Rhododendron molle]|uniref:Uncharacterized protein n=1 Tax=Rhododendron molle TaxID=49168 RepID=A0ACC0NPP0_RHOML|nr:hypothetical protein RHMOL_Rhmol05G0106400 [Rhododendron molle]
MTDLELASLYENWLVGHGKTYNAAGQKERRFEIFKDNLRFIEEHNSVKRSYKVGLNRFADLTNEEHRSMSLSGTMKRVKSNRMPGRSNSNRYVVRDGETLPKRVDWRERGAVNSVKDQGQCVRIRLSPLGLATTTPVALRAPHVTVSLEIVVLVRVGDVVPLNLLSAARIQPVAPMTIQFAMAAPA